MQASAGVLNLSYFSIKVLGLIIRVKIQKMVYLKNCLIFIYHIFG